ncbi:phage head spike fiber domain-containing protein [Pannonibacter phragmitetus]|uniref:phage head spike fiber domain-containing protein n=1 Tax=Pannonibacter phragmitetus TaxID=121719 RepID=UPI000B96DC43|nr:hypothetical protein [Pannonibacter phragmitetus]
MYGYRTGYSVPARPRPQSFAPGTITDLRFDVGRYRLNGGTVSTSTIDGYHTRSSSRWAERADGSWQEFVTNAAAIMPQRGYDAREGHTVLNPNPLNPRAWTLVGGSATDEAGTFLGFSSARRVTSEGGSSHRIRDDVTGGIVSGQTYALRALYAGTGRFRAGVRQDANTSILTGNVGALSSGSSALGSFSAIENINRGGGIYEVRAILTASATVNVTVEVGPDSATTGADVVVIAAQIVQRGYQMPFGRGTVAADTMVVPAAAAGMAVNPAASGLTMFWRGRDYPSAAGFPRSMEIRIDGSNRLSFERRMSDGVARPAFAGLAGASTALSFGTLEQLPYGSEYAALATWRPDGTVWLRATGVAASTGSGRTMMVGTPATIGIGCSGNLSDRLNSTTRRCGLMPHSLSDGDALALFNQINEGL